MASYQKYAMMGVTTILLPLGKLVLKKMMNKFKEDSEYDSAAEENEEFTPMRRSVERGA